MAAFLTARTLRSWESPHGLRANLLQDEGYELFAPCSMTRLGGFPYETATATEIHDRVCNMGFIEEHSFRLPKTLGLFGSGCHEFVFQKIR